MHSTPAPVTQLGSNILTFHARHTEFVNCVYVQTRDRSKWRKMVQKSTFLVWPFQLVSDVHHGGPTSRSAHTHDIIPMTG